MAINFGLAPQPINPLQALQAYGQAREQAVERRNAEAKIAAQAKVTDALAKGDIPTAQGLLLAARDWQGVTALTNIAKAQQEAAGRKAFAGFVGDGGTAPALTAAPVQQPAGSAPATADGGSEGDIVVNARPTMEQQIASLAEVGGPELVQAAMKYRESISTLKKADREQLDAETEALGALAPQLLALPQEQRAALLQTQRDRLNAYGIDDDELAALDLSDTGLKTLQTQAIGVKAALQMEQAEDHFNRSEARQASQFQQSQATTIRGQNMTDARVRESNMIQAVGVGKNQRKTETDLRKEFESLPDVKAFRDVRSAFNQVKALSKRNDGQSDNALIYSYMKMLDPGSVVREGEFALAGRAAGISERITNVLQRADNGQSLTPRMRQEIASAAAQVYTQRRNTYNTTADQFQGYARDYGVDPKRVARKYVPQGQPSAPAGFKVVAIKRGQ